jgi:citronellyl-CoA dehydrogenase
MHFTEEHDQFRAMVRGVVENEINPYVDEWEAAGTFPAHELFPKLGKLGLLGLQFDPAFGGQGADHSFTMVLCEELGRADAAGIPMAIGVQAVMATTALARYGSDELRNTYLRPAISGEAVVSIAVTEPEAGSDVAGIKTRAVRDGDDWVITGRKIYITNGTQADWVCLLARTEDPDPEIGGFNGMSLIVVPTDRPGFRVERPLHKLGNRCSDTAELVLDRVRVPVSNTIGEPGHGFFLQMDQFTDERLIGAYLVWPAAEKALARTADYLRERHAFGRPLSANQHLRYRMAELDAQVDLLKEYCRSAAQAYLDGADDVHRRATIAKLTAGRLAREVADTAVQYHGGLGYMEDYWVARYFRDARLVSIGGGADEVMLRILSMMADRGAPRRLRKQEAGR